MKRVAILLFIVAGISPNISSQTFDTILLRASLGGGGTIVDLPEALGWDENYFDNWDTWHIQGRVLAMPMVVNGVRIGAAISYERLYFYDVRVPYVPSPLYYWGTVAPVSILAIGSFDLGRNLFSEAGVGAYIFGDGVAIGIEARQGYRIRINDRFAIPITIHGALIFGASLYVPIGISGGVEYLIDSPF